jgi:predicted nuclease of restriction endonuclease-like (RecB) superfamily
MSKSVSKQQLFQSIKQLIQQAQQHVVRNINTTILITYFEIGRMIVEDEQNGKQRADYAKETLINLSSQLNKEFGKGYSVDNLQLMRKFHLTYQKYETLFRISKTPLQSIYETPSRNSKHQEFPLKLSWSHYVILIKINDEKERNFYEIEATQNNWSVRELSRQYNAAVYERIALSKDKKAVKKLSQKGQIIEAPTDVLKSHYVLEFLNLKEDNTYSETVRTFLISNFKITF